MLLESVTCGLLGFVLQMRWTPTNASPFVEKRRFECHSVFHEVPKMWVSQRLWSHNVMYDLTFCRVLSCRVRPDSSPDKSMMQPGLCTQPTQHVDKVMF